MSSVQTITVLPKDDDIRLDRWFRHHYPDLKNGMLQRLLRNKNIRVNGLKASSSQRLNAGDVLRIPPMKEEMSSSSSRVKKLCEKDIAFMRSLVIYKDKDVIVLNKPAGLAVQGGTKTQRHIDGLLDALRFEAEEKPRLVHRLDKDTSGVLILGRSAAAAKKLSKSFSSREAHKIYWAVVVGVPKISIGKIDAALSKGSGASGREQVRVDFENGQQAKTLYRVVDSLAKKASWLEMSPLTGRTHQLRVHCSVLNTPIVGDYKYAGTISDVTLGLESGKKMHLHARALLIPHPFKKGMLEVYADLPPHMKETFSFLGFEEGEKRNAFDFFFKEEL